MLRLIIRHQSILVQFSRIHSNIIRVHLFRQHHLNDLTNTRTNYKLIQFEIKHLKINFSDGNITSNEYVSSFLMT